uniref:Jumonji domain-containing protein 4 n=1 Tax=Anopheles epiroticus TaxID=199890 RepID=A0A182PAN7_9DIPT
MEEIEISSYPLDQLLLSANHRHEKIDRVTAGSISYDQFFRNFMQRNRAVVVEGIVQDWECFQRWIDRSVVPPKLNVPYLKETLPNGPVPVADCERQHYNSHEKLEQSLFEFLQSWETDDDRESTRKRFYLKDWHLRSLLPEYRFYRTPALFTSDWLNEYLVEQGADDYRFVYIGPKGTWTAFHADVFGSYSWSVNIFGRKRWYLLPPGEERKLLNSLRQLPFSVTEQSLRDAGVTFFTIEQKAGEAIFVPSGWYHQVMNVEDAISVNHNWFNGCNVGTVWDNLRSSLADVRREIDDCHDMDNFDDHCQVMLKASFGMDYADFLAIVLYVCDKRLKSIQEEGAEKVKQIDDYVLGKHHVMFDLGAIRDLLGEMVEKKYLDCYPALNCLAVNCLKKLVSVGLTL